MLFEVNHINLIVNNSRPPPHPQIFRGATILNNRDISISTILNILLNFQGSKCVKNILTKKKIVHLQKL